MPIGIVGELAIAGAGLARGYRRRPGRTAASFIPDPRSEEAARLYRSGDLARYRPDGEIEFVGRVDHQVKIRGFRIELGEIETVLGRHPQVRETTVVVWEDRSGVGTRIVAYVVLAESGAGEPIGELRAFLREKLPEYMVPSVFLALDSLPLTPSGKVDRRALPAPELEGAAESHVAPRNAVEEELARIWTRWLGIERVGAHDHFFELGGHSLLATQVVSEVRDAFAVNLPLRRMFERPILAELAAAIAEEQAAGDAAAADPLATRIRPRPADADPLPLSFSQLRQWLLHEIDPGTADFNIPGGVRLSGPLEAAALGRSIREIVDRHEALRTTFRRRDDEPVQVIAPPGEVPLPLVDLSGIGEAERVARRLVAEEANRPFDLEGGPLMRVSLVRLAADEHLLLYTMHHIVSDGWSMGIFFRELGALYQARTLGAYEHQDLPFETLWTSSTPSAA